MLTVTRLPMLMALVACILASSAGGEGDVLGLRDYKYWNDGAVRGCDVYDTGGKIRFKMYNRESGSVEKIEKYDRNGNKIEEMYFSEKGKLKAGIDGWAIRRSFYEGVRLASQITYDEGGKPIAKRLFSEGGQLIAAAFRDDETVNPYEVASIRALLLEKGAPPPAMVQE